jgi:hypothetical protein
MKNKLFNVWSQPITQLVFVPKRTFYTSYFTILFSLGLMWDPSVLSAQVSGKVFRDYNGNGVKDNTASFDETFVQGVEVKAYSAAGTQVGGTQTTNASGAYSFTGLTFPVRIEFGNFLTGDFSGPLSSQSASSVQFYSAATTTANLGINYPAHYCQGNPYLISPCYVNNRPTGASGNEVIVKYPNTASGTTSVNTYLAQAQDVGSTWGLAFNKSQQVIYASAFVKRHVALKDNDNNGKEDIGAIYSMTPTGSPVLWLDLATLGVDVGLSLMPTVAVRNLPTDKTQGSRDSFLFDLTGKIGLGDMDISDDSKLLYVVNLFDKKIYTIDIATKQLLGSGIAVPNACSGGTVRPFGLAYHRNKIYVGAVCDGATSQDTADVKANLYRLDGGTFTNILSFPLSYRKGAAEIGYNNQWYPWRSNFYPMVGAIFPPEYEYIYPQPIFADIQFDAKEELILVFNDRLGHQTGYINNGTKQTDNLLYTGIVGGDVLRAALVNGTYVLERNATVGGVTTAGAGNNQGPGGGEFYFQEEFLPYHEETVIGGAAVMAGSGLVAVNIFDPFDVFSGGTAWMNNQTGAVDRAYQVFKSTNAATFGKANGLGAVAFLCDAAPLEIGNRVWSDTNSNGIQDANESGISGVIVELYDGATKVGTATTNATGNYYFNNTNVNLNGATQVKPNTAYTLKIASTQFNNTGVAATPLSNLVLTTANAASTGLTGVADNDATAVGGLATIAYTTGNAGENNHALDFGFKPLVCSITVTPSVSGCYQSGGVSKATVSVEVAWENASVSPTANDASDAITITLGGQTRTINVGPYTSSSGNGVIVSPQVVAFELDANGSSGSISAVMVNNSACVATANYTAPAACSPTVCASGQTGGTVFNDYNADGIKQAGETSGLLGVTVKAYDCNGNLLATTTTDSYGKYTFSSITTYPIRVEFSGLSTLYGQGTPNGTNGRTTTQFVSTASCTVDLGVLNAQDFCQTNPLLYVPCYLNGASADAGSVNEPAIVGVNYDFTGSKAAVATIGQVGAVWGTAYSSTQNALYSAAMLRRHAGLTAAGLGGIFKTDLTTSSTTLFVDVENLGVNLGSIPNDAARGLTQLANPSVDADAFAKVGKVGMGGLEISDDGQTLYFVNLFEKKLHRLSVANPTAVAEVVIPTPSCGGGEARPWALKVYKEFAYVGVVCDGSTGTKSDLRAFVYKYNLATNVFDAVPIFDFPLTYPKGFSWKSAPNLTGWYPWTDDQAVSFAINDAAQTTCCQVDYGDVLVYPQPILADIDFDIDGSMVLGFADRFSFQTGNKNYAPNGANGTGNNGYSSLVGGDILRAYASGSTFILENNGKAGPAISAGADNNQGPGFGEFYNDDFLYGGLGLIHAENANGGLALKPGSGEVIYASMDPVNGVAASGGIRKVSNVNGDYRDAYDIYTGSLQNGLFSKSGGIGEPNIACATPIYLEIGNYVWQDTNKNGVQDPCEGPLSNVTLSLWKNGTQIATTTTNANGEYYFSSKSNLTTPANWTGTGADTTLLPNMAYEIRIDTAAQNTIFSQLALTVANATTNSGNDQNDNDATTSGVYKTIAVTTGAAGSTNHTYDFGFYSWQVVCPSDTGCCVANLLSNGSFETFSGGNSGGSYADDVTFGDDGTNFVLNNWNVSNLSGSYGVTIARAKCNRPNPVYYNSIDGANTVISYRGFSNGTDQHAKISQSFNVVANKRYSICFYMAPGMKCLHGTNQWIDISTAGGWTTSITSNSATLATQNFDIIAANANSSADPTIGQTNPTTWTKQTFYFTATTTETVSLNFDAYNPNGATTLGAYFLDNVSVCEKEVVCVPPTIAAVAGTSATCTNGIANADAAVAVRGIGSMAKYAYGTNGTTGLSALNATASTLDSIRISGLTNPSVATTYTFRIYGIDTTCYNDTTVVLNPAVCLPCSVTATFMQGACNNNGTTAISTDDYFKVTVSNITSTNGGTSGKYEVILNGSVLNIGGTAYGTPVTVGGILDFKSDGATTYNLTVRDFDIPTCVTTIFTTAVSASCSTINCKPIICLPVTLTKF